MNVDPLMPSGHVHPLYQLAKSFSDLRDVWCTFSVLLYFE